jgi:hypothetical protein
MFSNSPIDLAYVINETEIPELSLVVLGEAKIPVIRLSAVVEICWGADKK